MSLQFKNSSITALNLVASFPPRANALLELGPHFNSLAHHIRGKLLQTDAPPNAPPEIPRLIVAVNGIEYRMGLNRIEALIKEPPPDSPTRHLSDIKAAFSEITERIESIFKSGGILSDFVGVICTVHFPQEVSASLQDISKELFSGMTLGKTYEREVVTFGWQVGFLSKDRQHFINLNVKNYQRRVLNVQGIPQQPIALDLSKSTLADQGVEVMVDINNRPKNTKVTPRAEFLSAFEVLDSEVSSLEKGLFGELRN